MRRVGEGGWCEDGGMRSPATNYDSVFHSRFNRVVAIVIWALEAFVLVSNVISGEFAEGPALVVVPVVLGAVLVYAVLWRPSVAVSADGVTLVNVLRTIVVPWPALIDVDTRFSLSLRTPGGTFSAWAAPAPGRAGAAVANRAERRHGPHSPTPSIGGRARPGDLISTESGEAAYMVRERWNELVEAGLVEVGVAETTPVAIHWHWVQGAVVAALIIAVVAVVS